MHEACASTKDLRGRYGGEASDESCGVIEHTIIRYAGFEIGANNELHGITFGGCGYRTIVRDLHVAHTLDDGVELFGGNVNLQRVSITDAGDMHFCSKTPHSHNIKHQCLKTSSGIVPHNISEHSSPVRKSPGSH